MSETKIKIGVTEFEPGWVMSYFQGDKPAGADRRQWLERALKDFVAARPQYVAGELREIEHAGELYGLMIWFQVSPVTQRDMLIAVSDAVLAANSREYVEAVSTEVIEFLARESQLVGSLAIVNRRGLAFVVDATRSNGRLMLAAELEPQLDEAAKVALRAWCDEPTSPYFVRMLPSG